MSPSTTHSSETVRPKNYFATTHWSVVLTAGRSDSTHARDALARLCQTYWYPLYAYARRRGFSPHDAEDVTQGFFRRLLQDKQIPISNVAMATTTFVFTGWTAKTNCGCRRTELLVGR